MPRAYIGEFFQTEWNNYSNIKKNIEKIKPGKSIFPGSQQNTIQKGITYSIILIHNKY